MKLYHVYTVVPEYHGCKDVAFTWFKDGGNPTGPSTVVPRHTHGNVHCRQLPRTLDHTPFPSPSVILLDMPTPSGKAPPLRLRRPESIR
jgi:hypothetical protein